MKPDDCSLSPEQYARVRKEAERALNEAGAIGRYPTCIPDIMSIANVEEVPGDVLNESFLTKMRLQAGTALKKALSKVLGLFDSKAGLIFIDRSMHLVKQTFVRLHETAHGFLKWQRPMYAVVEDCEQSLEPGVADLFDREANVFASEVLFQLDGFTNEAEEKKFSILTPVNLSKKYGASIYSAVRRYVSQNWRACAVLVLNPPEIIEGDGFRASVRRFVASAKFIEIFGNSVWPEYFTPDDHIGAFVPVGNRRMSGKRELTLKDRNGDDHLCLAEAFTQGHQVFVLILSVETLTSSSIIIPSSAAELA